MILKYIWHSAVASYSLHRAILLAIVQIFETSRGEAVEAETMVWKLNLGKILNFKLQREAKLFKEWVVEILDEVSRKY